MGDDELLIQKVQKWVMTSFTDHGVKRKVIDCVKNHLSMQFQPKLIKCSREKGQKYLFLN